MKVLQINSVCGFGSTGRIATDIADMLYANGHECRIAFGRGAPPENYKEIAVPIGNHVDNMLHGFKTRLLDRHGFGSKNATRKFLRWVEEYDPDVIHLHNLHGYYIHVGLLFDYLKKSGKPVVWTMHDCWAFTGHCAHFSAVGCEQWKVKCKNCIQRNRYPRTIFPFGVETNFVNKQKAFNGVPNMTLVVPSNWLASVVNQSYLRNYQIRVIYNGIDLNTFKPRISDFRKTHSIENKTIILGVANIWEDRKGLNDFLALNDLLAENCKIVLVGLSDQQLSEVPDTIVKIKRTSSTAELAEIYSAADVYVNPSVEETMGLTTAEALACGTPVITYDKTAVPEVADETCGIVVPCSPAKIFDAIDKALLMSEGNCLNRAQKYDKQKRYQEYLDLYYEKNHG